MLDGAETNRLALAVPSDYRDRFEFAESFSVALGGKSRQVGELDVDDLVGAVADKPERQRLRALRQGRIQMFADTEGTDRISRNVPVDHWLTTEVPDGVVHYFYWQGQWYEIGAEYLTVIERRIAELLARPSSSPPASDQAAVREPQLRPNKVSRGGAALLSNSATTELVTGETGVRGA